MSYFHCETDDSMVVMHLGDEKLIAWRENTQWNIEYYKKGVFDHSCLASQQDAIHVFTRLTYTHMKNRNKRIYRLNQLRNIQ